MTILLAWELGAGLGHLVPLTTLARELVRRGHRVAIAGREMAPARRLLGEAEISLLQAPFVTRTRAGQIRPVLSMAHILHNVGFGDYRDLDGVASSWRDLIRKAGADMIICDHSPSALLAARTVDAIRVVSGAGFYCPPRVQPLPAFASSRGVESDLAAAEARLLSHANRWLRTRNAAPLACLADLYHDVDHQYLMTFPELDHYAERPGAWYCGVWSSPGARPDWPAGGVGDAGRAFVYLPPSPARDAVLDELRRRRVPTLVYAGEGGGAPPPGPDSSLRFSSRLLDLRRTFAECDFAVLAGTTTITQALLAATPVILIPAHLENLLFARRVAALGAGSIVFKNQPKAARRAVGEMLGRPEYSERARAFADRYRDFDPGRELSRVVDDLLAGLARTGHEDGTR